MSRRSFSPHMSSPTCNGDPIVIPADDRWALFLDFDGSLVDIAPDPYSVVIPHDLAAMLVAIRHRLSGALAFVTGRSIATIDALFSPHKFDVAGAHGAEIRLGGDLIVKIDCAPPAWHRAEHALSLLRSLAPGCVVENKGHAIAVHWRQTPQFERAILDHMLEIAEGLGSAYRVQRGKCVVEILPAAAEKASAIETLMQRPPYKGCRPIYLGDDLTDEPALALVKAQGGISIHVGSRPTVAEYRLDRPAAVRDWLRALAGGAKMTPLEAPYDLQ